MGPDARWALIHIGDFLRAARAVAAGLVVLLCQSCGRRLAPDTSARQRAGTGLVLLGAWARRRGWRETAHRLDNRLDGLPSGAPGDE
ncbi:hypothetical protein LNKW23_18210 [Paralimibaculum aggregatum]|uniref:Uncharacterized protein n=1 Tax=Paralimibaculum aggregatum TaxID=3036245 RepID=A0ABQ6LH33_9RHOB|nr:hypothetical protein LNKW23_18210 [Limibaculum sp. NKW23]